MIYIWLHHQYAPSLFASYISKIHEQVRKGLGEGANSGKRV